MIALCDEIGIPAHRSYVTMYKFKLPLNDSSFHQKCLVPHFWQSRAVLDGHSRAFTIAISLASSCELLSVNICA